MSILETHSLAEEADELTQDNGERLSPGLLCTVSASPFTKEGSMGEMEEKIGDLKVSRVWVPRAVIFKL